MSAPRDGTDRQAAVRGAAKGIAADRGSADREASDRGAWGRNDSDRDTSGRDALDGDAREGGAADRGAADFAIALELLDEHPAPLAWSNLGDWTATRDYAQACRQLALRVGKAAALQPPDVVLDLACGHGASLALWPEAFGVRQVTGLELQARCVARIRRQAPAQLKAIVQGRFDTLPPPAGLGAQSFDAALCVDAAYHARSLDAFAALAAQVLRPQGRLAFTTLIRPGTPGQSDAPPSPALCFGLARAGIPAASVLSADAIVATLARKGFHDIHIELLDAEVLAGFDAFVQHRRAELSWAQKASAGWLKIQGTAWLCRYLYRSGALHYGLVRATRTTAGA